MSTLQEIRRLQRHNRGYELRLPPGVRRELQLEARDHILFEWSPGDAVVKLSRVVIGQCRHVKAKKTQTDIPAEIPSR